MLLTLVQVVDEIHPALWQLFITYAVVKLAQRLTHPCEGGSVFGAMER